MIELLAPLETPKTEPFPELFALIPSITNQEFPMFNMTGLRVFCPSILAPPSLSALTVIGLPDVPANPSGGSIIEADPVYVPSKRQSVFPGPATDQKLEI